MAITRSMSKKMEEENYTEVEKNENDFKDILMNSKDYILGGLFIVGIYIFINI